ncbi:porin [Chelatococcus reniformis]|uniref:Porin n=1 Tax=Chelatococcus reniformis TaxID=1494448 RepID=A0A916UTB7_9HYPH|nr:porin [Chelatococcus reniformis]GGC87425.1 polymerase [Chelatococcus reniformis]
MKLVKSLLLGSAAGLFAVAGAQAADLPMTKAAPVEYVKVCAVHGVGFFYIPGTDTCIKIGGRAQFQYEFAQYRSLNGVDRSNFIGAGRIQVDARTATAWGTLRTFIRFDIASRTGNQHGSTGVFRQWGPNSFNATGIDTANRANKYVDVDKAFIQFAGLTAGRASSFYDFYANDIELTGFSITSDVWSTNLLAYTYHFGDGWSATVSAEDPSFRRMPLFSVNPQSAVPGANLTFAQPTTGNISPSLAALCTDGGVNGCTYGSPVYLFNAAGDRIGFANVDISQRQQLPDFVANLRVDQDWGSAQISAAVHQVSIGGYNNLGVYNNSGVLVSPANVAAAGVYPQRPEAAYGYAVQGGVKFNLPFLAPGDALWLQAAYARGAMSYTGVNNPLGYDFSTGAGIGGGTRFNVYTLDGYVDPNSGDIKLTKSWSAAAAFLHYWSPEWRSGFVFTYGQLDYPGSARTAGPLGNLYANSAGSVTAASAAAGSTNIAFKSFNEIVTMANLVWSPVKDLDIGVEVLYQRIDVKGRVVDNNKYGALTGKTVSFDDNWLTRFRIDRTF